jgi:hypothetical protein
MEEEIQDGEFEDDLYEQEDERKDITTPPPDLDFNDFTSSIPIDMHEANFDEDFQEEEEGLDVIPEELSHELNSLSPPTPKNTEMIELEEEAENTELIEDVENEEAENTELIEVIEDEDDENTLLEEEGTESEKMNPFDDLEEDFEPPPPPFPPPNEDDSDISDDDDDDETHENKPLKRISSFIGMCCSLLCVLN